MIACKMCVYMYIYTYVWECGSVHTSTYRLYGQTFTTLLVNVSVGAALWVAVCACVEGKEEGWLRTFRLQPVW